MRRAVEFESFVSLYFLAPSFNELIERQMHRIVLSWIEEVDDELVLWIDRVHDCQHNATLPMKDGLLEIIIRTRSVCEAENVLRSAWSLDIKNTVGCRDGQEWYVVAVVNGESYYDATEFFLIQDLACCEIEHDEGASCRANH